MKYKSEIYNRINYEKRFKILKKLFYPFLAGVLLAFVAYVLRHQEYFAYIAATSAILIVPFFVYLYVLVILHWKERYIGNHSTLWGILILIETSGWMKLVYIFRHIIPDLSQKGRYDTQANKSVELTSEASPHP